jgi:DNA-binding PadR family transcriptional regulator
MAAPFVYVAAVVGFTPRVGTLTVTENGRRAKYYSLTNAGRETLARTTWEWQRQTTAISRVLKPSLGEL